MIQVARDHVSNNRTQKSPNRVMKIKNFTLSLIALTTLSLAPISTASAHHRHHSRPGFSIKLHQEFKPHHHSVPRSYHHSVPRRVTRVKGRNASLVAYQGGAFVQVSNKEWVNNNANGSYRFKEINRDEWSVYLQAVDRPVSIQLDLWNRKVKYSSPNKNFVLYRIQTARPNRINGWMASKVKYRGGGFTQINGGEWIERNSSGTYKFREVNRDQWSVYLQAVDRPVAIKLDLWSKKVKYYNPKNSRSIHRIRSAQI